MRLRLSLAPILSVGALVLPSRSIVPPPDTLDRAYGIAGPKNQGIRQYAISLSARRANCQSSVWRKAGGEGGKITVSRVPSTFFPAWTSCSTRAIRYHITAAGLLYSTSACSYTLAGYICNITSGSCTGWCPYGAMETISVTSTGLSFDSQKPTDPMAASCPTTFVPWES